MDLMLVSCVLAGWVLPFGPLLVFCSVVSPTALVGLLLLYVGQYLAAAFRSLGSSVTGVRCPWPGLILSAGGRPLGPSMSPVVVPFRPFQFSRVLRSLSFSCIAVMSFLVVVLKVGRGSPTHSTAYYYTEEALHIVFLLHVIPCRPAPFKFLLVDVAYEFF